MPTDMKDAKPRRMHGIVPTPYEIPPEHRPVSKASSSQPLFIKLICGFLVIRAGINLLLALVPWSDPNSGIASFFLAHRELAFSMLPRSFFPAGAISDVQAGSLAQTLPFAFLLFGLIYLVSAWKLWDLDKFWVSLIRWGMMFISGATVAKILIALSVQYIGPAGPPLSDAAEGALALMVGWNLIIFFCFALLPDVDSAYDSNS